MSMKGIQGLGRTSTSKRIVTFYNINEIFKKMEPLFQINGMFKGQEAREN